MPATVPTLNLFKQGQLHWERYPTTQVNDAH
eukprot:SAG31_NODE_47196_length_251_cov_0.782895_1_plen_30_part_01